MSTLTSVRDAARGATHRLALLPGRLLAGLGIAAALPQGVGEARKNPRQGDERDAGKNHDEGNKRENEQQASQDGDVKPEKRDDESGKDESRNDREDRNDGDEKVRQESKRQDASSESTDEDQGGTKGGGRNSDADAEQAQRDGRNNNSDDGLDDEPSPTPTPAPPPVTNPNVPIPDTSGDPDDVELIVQSNPDVIAQTSTSGGFAFARSGGVTAITGPDGARIIRTGEPDAPAPTPTPPPDGGDNNPPDFTS